MRARGARGANWYSESRSESIKKKARTQSLWNLTLAGDFHETLETERPNAKTILMRVMLVSNLDRYGEDILQHDRMHLVSPVALTRRSSTKTEIGYTHTLSAEPARTPAHFTHRHLVAIFPPCMDVQQRFANGTQGRLLSWFPDNLPQKRTAISASCPELTTRFVKEASMTKKEMLADRWQKQFSE